MSENNIFREFMLDVHYATSSDKVDEMLNKMLATETLSCVRRDHLNYDDNSFKNYTNERDVEIFRKAYEEGYNAGYKQCMNSKMHYKNHKPADGSDVKFGGF